MSVRIRTRTDGSSYVQVRYRIGGRAGSVSFDDHEEALQFDALIGKVGAIKALQITKIVIAQDRALTVGQWLTHHNDHLTGVVPETLANYRRYAAKDFPDLVDIPLSALTPDDVKVWLQKLRNDNGAMPSAKTIANKHGYLAGALNAAVERGHIKSNPCEHVRLPQSHRGEENCYLEPAEYQLLRSEIPDHWQPLVDFLVTSGARWSEATALRPSDVDRAGGTVRISRAWKKAEGGGWELGPTKTRKSVRTINLPARVIDQLDYSQEFLFTNSGRGRHNPGGVVRNANFAPHVWHPAVARAQAAGLTKRPRIHDLRHTCASWLIGAGRPLPAVQAQLGHNSIVTTVSVYGHLDRASGRDNADVLAPLLD